MLKRIAPLALATTAFGVALCSVSFGTLANLGHRAGDAGLKYQFNGNAAPVYLVTISGETGDVTETDTGYISYAIKSVDPANHQITFGCTSHLDKSVNNGQQRLPQGLPPFSFPSADAAPETMIDAFGKVVRTNITGDGDQLPFTLGQSWQMCLPPLPADGQNTWTVDEPISLYSINQSNNRPGLPPWMQQPQQRTVRSAHMTQTFTKGAADGNKLTITRELVLATDEKVGDDPIEKITGKGTIVFDTDAGLVQSIDWKQTDAINDKNISVKVPVSVTARLLTPEEFAKLKADQDAADKKNRDHDAMVSANEVNDLPDGTAKTAMIGGNGGSPFIKVEKDKRTVIGFAVEVADWGGRKCLRHVEPLFDKPADMDMDNTTFLLAKDGYVVGGILLDTDGGADGIQVIFMKKTDKGDDASDSYKSDWLGFHGNDKITQLAGKGERVVGTFGRQGLNQDALGLVVEATAEQIAKMKADEAAGPHQDSQGQDLPGGTDETKMVGGNGGGPYVKLDPDKRTVIGFQLKMGHWAGHTCLGDATPLYDKPDDTDPDDAKIVLAKDGYVVGGMIVNNVGGADGIRIIFMKKTDKGVDVTDSYMSKWYGWTEHMNAITLAGKGERVIGLFGRHGMNMDAIGLIVESPAGADKPAN